ncbi:ribitol-5-phosphate transferase FKTN isoform X2 [Halyomorpha halys]
MIRKRKCLYYFIIGWFCFAIYLFCLDYKDSVVLKFYLPLIIFDIEVINEISRNIGLEVFIIDGQLLQFLHYQNQSLKFETPIILGIDSKFLDKLQSLLTSEILKMNNVKAELFYNEKPLMNNFGFKLDLPSALLLQRNYVYIIYILYPREDNTWWYGNLASDRECSVKLEKFNSIRLHCDSSLFHESLLNKFEFTVFDHYQTVLSHILIPKDEINFIAQSKSAKFIECNYSRAEIFKKKYAEKPTSGALRFKHKAWKLLSKTKTILDLLSVPFWISSGTCLGFFRECDIIPYSKDVDIGINAQDYDERIILHMEAHGLILKHWFGQPNDSLELSFIDNRGVKLDIFFFYEENNHIWNGGTQLRTGKKFKYIFPKFNLCWTFFCGLKLRIPCEIESYIVANYGNNWFIPIYEWDWKSSPSNVVPNGFWPSSVHKNHLLK